MPFAKIRWYLNWAFRVLSDTLRHWSLWYLMEKHRCQFIKKSSKTQAAKHCRDLLQQNKGRDTLHLNNLISHLIPLLQYSSVKNHSSRQLLSCCKHLRRRNMEKHFAGVWHTSQIQHLSKQTVSVLSEHPLTFPSELCIHVYSPKERL